MQPDVFFRNKRQLYLFTLPSSSLNPSTRACCRFDGEKDRSGEGSELGSPRGGPASPRTEGPDSPRAAPEAQNPEPVPEPKLEGTSELENTGAKVEEEAAAQRPVEHDSGDTSTCLLYTSDAADELWV